MELPKKMNVGPSERCLRIAIVYSRLPLPMQRADQLTVAHLISFLHERGHEVDLYCFETGGVASSQQINWLRAKCRTVNTFKFSRLKYLSAIFHSFLKRIPFQVSLFSSADKAELLQSNKDSYDIVYTYYIRSAEITKSLRQDAARSAPVTFLAYQLSQALNTERISNNAPNLAYSLFYKLEYRLIAKYEASIWRYFNRSVLIGPDDVAAVEACCKKFNMPTIDNFVYGAHGTDVDRFKPRSDVTKKENHLVFSGVMRTPTNIQAVKWFVEKVWPLIRTEIPEATFTIVGREPPGEIRAMSGSNGINVTGTVADPADYIAEASICINPMQAGGGMQNKLIEYLASQVVVVATSVANEGIAANHGEHLVIADEPSDFARAVISLLRDANWRATLAKAGRVFVERNWTWEAHWLKLEKDFFDAIDGLPPCRFVRPSDALGPGC